MTLIHKFLLLLALVLAPGTALACNAYPQPQLPTAPLSIVSLSGRVMLKVELAQSEDQRNCGLMGRSRLADGTGMLFDMRPAGPAFFWMKNTPEPLDLIFLNDGGRVVYLIRNAEPYSERTIGTGQQVAAVLELAAGEAGRLGIEIGSTARLPWVRR